MEERRPLSGLASSILALLFILEISAGTTLYEDYEECRDREKFGNFSLICDFEHKLQRQTLRRLDSLLRDLQGKIACECENKCVRGNGLSDKYIALLIVTTSAKIEDAPLNETSKRIYDDAKLGNEDCDNGLLILFIKDQQKLAAYRGNGRFVLLTDKDMARLYQLATKGAPTEDTAPLQYLLSNYDDKERPDVQQAETWAPIIGLTVALVIILLVLALLLSILCAKLCGCCWKRRAVSKMDQFYVSKPMPPSYKNIEPIYIVTPPLSDSNTGTPSYRQHRNQNTRASLHSDIMYGPSHYAAGPYARPTPPPLPPHPMHRAPPTVSQPAVPLRSRSITPTSTHRTRIQPQPSTSTRGSAATTPIANKKDKVKASTIGSRRSNATYYTANRVGGGSPTQDAHSRSHSRQRQIQLQQQPTPSDGESSGGVNSFSFLDPRRRQEIQTKEEYII